MFQRSAERSRPFFVVVCVCATYSTLVSRWPGLYSPRNVARLSQRCHRRLESDVEVLHFCQDYQVGTRLTADAGQTQARRRPLELDIKGR